MKRYFNLGLIGYPLEHSLSPVLQEAALRAAGMAGRYNLYTVAPVPQGTPGLVGLLARLRSGEVQGLNVTIPHKQTVLPLLDELTPQARQIGAVNTLFVREGKVIGDNTDAPGFWADLKRQAVGRELNGSKPHTALVLGAGGAARAVVYALSKAGWQVTLAARRPTQAQDLLVSLGASGKVVPLERSGLAAVEEVELLVNATPLGMFPHPEACPWPEGLDLPAGAFVYDLVYNPLETRLVQRARAQSPQGGGAGGLGMLVEQAALAFQRWTGLDVPREPLWKSLQGFLAQKEGKA